MTDLQKLYKACREGTKWTPPRPVGHHAALRRMARLTNIDEATLDRCLRRANHTDTREAKRAKAVTA